MSEDTERLTAGIVLVGKFNPAIFSPAWIANTGLIDEKALEGAEVSVIHPEMAIFQVDGFSFDIRNERFAIDVASEPLVRVLDATLVLFNELLPHTPMTELGINYVEHFRLDSPERRVKFGRALAPLDPWGAWGNEISGLTGDLTSGVLDITMVRSYEPAGSGQRRVDVQPSRLVEPKTVGVYVMVNDHRVLKDLKNEDGTKAVMETLSDRFDESISVAKSIIADLKTFAMALPL